MAFRADEEIKDGRAWAENYLLSRLNDLSIEERRESKSFLEDLFIDLGPVIDWYPDWHPLLNIQKNSRNVVVPHADCGYKDLDHTVFFAHGFITCPYADGQRVIDSVHQQLRNNHALITAERLGVKFYSSKATAILVKCEWSKPLYEDGTIPLSTAMPLILEKAIEASKMSSCAETWDNMLPHLLGKPHGRRSSLFVNQETGQAIKKTWEMLINSGMFGPINTRK
ncbi:hypothetical protein [Acinetobacter towneri]|uniref:hypothetical protein n=1 Tax=Acinetobacter towneri TaxID=202956 RepID=UPI0002D07DFA|nr:hypothetical protein [Acinetobacter towneri]ENV69800.1 hypothetical protein F947_01477 [Acinetobacter towneri DSM 14962 = CIP 107472]MCO8056113.1 hypothetical protein [Acinetobacter towneri]